jgi:hypothetical protein
MLLYVYILLVRTKMVKHNQKCNNAQKICQIMVQNMLLICGIFETHAKYTNICNIHPVQLADYAKKIMPPKL